MNLLVLYTNLFAMIDRIKLLMKEKKMLATQFSDEIGIQRSSLSHVLSGRNKPSLDFMLKIKNRFSDINLNWLLLGQENMLQYEEDEKNLVGDGSKLEIVSDPRVGLNVGKRPNKKENFEGYGIVKETKEKSTDLRSAIQGEKKITQVILLYNDDTFSTYQSEE